MKKILVYAYYAKNLGDDLFLKVLFDRYPNVEFYLLHANESYRNIFSKYDNVKIFNVKRNRLCNKIYNKFNHIIDYFKDYSNFDALIYIGGSIFIENNKFWKKQYKERKLLNSKFIQNNKKIFIIGSNFGPFKNDIFKDKYESLLKECHDVCFRDEYSYDLFKINKNIRIAPDVVFQLNADSIYRQVDKENKNVGFSIIDLEHRTDLKKYCEVYDKTIKLLIEKYVNQGYRITMFSFCKVEGDEKAIERVLTNIDEKILKNIDIVKYDGNIDNFIDIYKKMNIIIGTRFHSIILSQIFNQTVYPLIYSKKTYDTLRYLGLDKYYSDIKDLSSINLDSIIEISKFNKLENKQILSESNLQFAKLDEFIK